MKNLVVYVSHCSFLRAKSNQSTSVREARAGIFRQSTDQIIVFLRFR